MEDKASDPAAWPEPFRREPANSPPLIEIAPGHWVEARAVAAARWRLGPRGPDLGAASPGRPEIPEKAVDAEELL